MPQLRAPGGAGRCMEAQVIQKHNEHVVERFRHYQERLKPELVAAALDGTLTYYRDSGGTFWEIRSPGWEFNYFQDCIDLEEANGVVFDE